MINLFVTYRCNLACGYCFARELADLYPDDMRTETFNRLLAWMRRANVPAAAFIGGEPTLHGGLAAMIEAASATGIAPILFTNGLFGPDLADRLTGSVVNFVVNYNNPAGYAPAQRRKLQAALSRLAAQGARITFSKNFAPGGLDHDYLIEAARHYGVRSVRYDISRPGRNGTNAFFTSDQVRDTLAHVVTFVEKCEAHGIRTGLDCCLRLCDLTPAQRRFLERVSMKFTGICHPSIDIHPDLSASYCLPLHDVRVPDVTAFADTFALMQHFANRVRDRRFAGTDPGCLTCAEFMRTCQGGCMALRPEAPVTNLCAPQPKPETSPFAHENL
ncbi:radical SAM protein [Desulfosarcina ovata]|uniref:Radical SAM core domain-containing protein n=1 Tax=Desulfosarcina ovata subsp. ovata TaxID=2752305 RepID=A0A5K8AF19_9BACT|nr:radical SAM protein [Desulfosarcina ovata]BBO91242.1 hypothetical protein DSCOOX_44220 [Desulfosarcina ovata subsp. ovata]